jgi:hypothetical protein
MEPEMRVFHYGTRSTEDWPRTMNAYGVGDGAFLMKHVRCGDLRALRMLSARVLRELARHALRPVRGRGGHPGYLKGVFRGAWRSFEFGIDRSRRLYIWRGLT